MSYSCEPLPARSIQWQDAGVFLLWISCQAPPPPTPQVQVEVLTTRAPVLPLPEGARTWKLATEGNVRSDLASLLTGSSYTEHGVSDPVSHTLAVRLPPTRRLGDDLIGGPAASSTR